MIPLGLIFGRNQSGAFAPVGVTLNPADKAAAITLTGGNLVATKATPTLVGGVRATLSRTTGKYVFEITHNVVFDSSNTSVGFANATQSLTAYLGSAGSNSVGFFAGSGQTWFNGGILFTGSAGTRWLTAGSTSMIAVDLDAKKAWIKAENAQWNGVDASHDPATGLGGVSIATLTGALFPAFSAIGQNTSATLNFGATTFTNAIPSGFFAWDE